MKKEQLTNVEGTIGYIFYNKDLLQQAFTRTTYKNELGGEDNELLEFIGDKANTKEKACIHQSIMKEN